MSVRIVTRWRNLTLLALFALWSIVVAWQLSGGFGLAALAKCVLYSLPLLLPVPGIVRGNRYTFRWATLCVLPYFVVSLTEAFADPPSRPFAIAMVGASLVWFFSLIAFLRVSPLENQSNARSEPDGLNG